MWVKNILLKDFRNFENLRAELSPGINIIHGDNAQGKTNLLEAVYFCATGRSRRAGEEKELIRFGRNEARLRLEIKNEDGVTRTIDAQIRQSERRAVKGIAVDNIPVKQLGDLNGLLIAVAFAPEDLRLIKAGPSERRAFMDRELCQLSRVYYHNLLDYYKALKQRNTLLKSIQKNPPANPDTEAINVWDEQLVKHGRYITVKRAEFILRAGEAAREIHARITGGAECLSILYQPYTGPDDDYMEKLKKGLSRDIALGSTHSGIHRDDLRFTVNGADARVYGSQGQQRTAALSAKLAEIDVIRENLNTRPVLLLDDVLSELDEKRQAFLLSKIWDTQTVLTCAGVEDILKKGNSVKDINIKKMESGKLSG